MTRGSLPAGTRSPLKCLGPLVAVFLAVISAGCVSGRRIGDLPVGLPFGNSQAAKDREIREAAEADKQFPNAAQAGLKSAAR